MFSAYGTGQSPAWIPQRGAVVKVGCFSIAVDLQATETDLINEVTDLYRLYPLEPKSALPDFAVALRCPTVWSTFFGSKIQAFVNGHTPFEPLPRQHGLPMLESAINWLIAMNISRFLLLHAGVMERSGKALVLPGRSGSGKSTLCAALSARGWRLLSDEFALVRPDDGLLQPHPRPISLKNASIELIANRIPEVHLGKRHTGTIKGTVAFMRAPQSAIDKADQPAKPTLIVFPKHGGSEQAELKPLERSHVFMYLTDHSTNYAMLLDRGFETLAGFVEACRSYVLSYQDLDEALAVIEDL